MLTKIKSNVRVGGTDTRGVGNCSLIVGHHDKNLYSRSNAVRRQYSQISLCRTFNEDGYRADFLARNTGIQEPYKVLFFALCLFRFHSAHCHSKSLINVCLLTAPYIDRYEDKYLRTPCRLRV